MLRNRALIVFVAVMILTGCGSGFKMVTKGELRSPGCTIRAQDGSFTLRTGQVFVTPFCCRNARSTVNWPKDDLPEYYQDFLRLGPKAVLVDVPSRDLPLYGQLLFLSVPNGAIGPASRCHLIKIPEEYVRLAEEGRASVIFEYVFMPKTNLRYYGWVLWLQDTPFS
jgi:hypothetical protein